METPDSYTFDVFWMTVDEVHYVVFTVQACQQAHIVLTQQLGITADFTYEIVLGAANNQVKIPQTYNTAFYLKYLIYQ